MANELLRIQYPTKYPACEDCGVAAALGLRIHPSTVSEIARQNHMSPEAWVQINCHIKLGFLKTVPNPKSQMGMQALLHDSHSIVGLTEPEVVVCPGKSEPLPPTKS